jgi:hypothetical protein
MTDEPLKWSADDPLPVLNPIEDSPWQMLEKAKLNQKLKLSDDCSSNLNQMKELVKNRTDNKNKRNDEFASSGLSK